MELSLLHLLVYLVDALVDSSVKISQSLTWFLLEVVQGYHASEQLWLAHILFYELQLDVLLRGNR